MRHSYREKTRHKYSLLLRIRSTDLLEFLDRFKVVSLLLHQIQILIIQLIPSHLLLLPFALNLQNIIYLIHQKIDRSTPTRSLFCLTPSTICSNCFKNCSLLAVDDIALKNRTESINKQKVLISHSLFKCIVDGVQ